MKEFFNFFANSSIKNKLIYVSMGLCIATVSIVTFVLVTLSTNEIKNNLLNEISLVTDIIGKRSKTALVYLQYDSVQENIKDLQSVHYVDLGCVFNSEKKLVSSYIRAGKVATCPEVILDEAEYAKIDSSNLDIRRHIVSSGNIIGYFYLKGDLSKLNQRIIELVSNALAIMLALLLLAYVLSNSLQRIISGPIIELEKLAKKVSKGNYDLQIKKKFNDEVGLLTDAFNKMIKTVKERNDSLYELNNELEEKVNDRTKDLRFTIERLEKANKLNKLWIQNIGHELRTPIHIILNFTELGERYADKIPIPLDKIKQSYIRISNAGKRLIGLIDDLLDFGKIESGKFNFHFEEANVDELIKGIKGEIGSLAEGKKLSIKYKPYKKGVLVICDKKRISQVLMNLMSNAVKFSPDNSTISIKTYESDVNISSNKKVKSLSIELSDQGVGIPEDELESIFNTFEQSTKTSDGSGGTGLGLSISKEIIKAHNGNLTAKNNDGVGSIFIINIPANYNKVNNDGEEKSE